MCKGFVYFSKEELTAGSQNDIKSGIYIQTSHIHLIKETRYWVAITFSGDHNEDCRVNLPLIEVMSRIEKANL